MARRNGLLDRRALAQEGQEALRCGFVRRELPDAPEERHRGFKLTLRPFRRRKCQNLLGDLGRITNRNRPGRGRIEDRAPWPEIRNLLFDTSSQAKASRGSTRHQPLEPFEHLLGGVRFDGDVAFLVDQRRAMAAEHWVYPGDPVVGDAERQAEAMPSFRAFFGGREETYPKSTCRRALCRAAPRPGTSWSRRSGRAVRRR